MRLPLESSVSEDKRDTIPSPSVIKSFHNNVQTVASKVEERSFCINMKQHIQEADFEVYFGKDWNFWFRSS